MGAQVQMKNYDTEFFLEINVIIPATDIKLRERKDALIAYLKANGWMPDTDYYSRALNNPRKNRDHGSKRVTAGEVYQAIQSSNRGLTKQDIMTAVYGYSEDLPANQQTSIAKKCYIALWKLRQLGKVIAQHTAAQELRYFTSDEQILAAGLELTPGGRFEKTYLEYWKGSEYPDENSS